MEGGAPPLRVTAADFSAAETRVRPSAMREVALEVPNVSWDDVGGLDDVKQSLKVRVSRVRVNAADRALPVHAACPGRVH